MDLKMKKPGILIALVGLTLALLVPAASAEAATAGGLDEIQAVMQAYVNDGEIAGAYVRISRHGEPIYSTSVGYSNVDSKTPIGADTIVRLFSMSKPITCAAVMKLREEGLVDLDDPVADYLPAFADMKVLQEDGSIELASGEITIRHLMMHVSGLGYAALPSRVSGIYLKENVFGIANRRAESLASHVDRLAELPLQAEPGSEWNYGESMAVLGRIIEVAADVPFRTYLKRHLLMPLDMRDTDFFVHAAGESRFARLYGQEDGGLVDRTGEASYGGDYRSKPLLEDGGAGLVGTAADYSRFGNMLLNLGTLDGVQLLTPESVRMMTSRQLSESFIGDRLQSVGRHLPTGFGFCGMSGLEMSDDGNVELGTFYGWGGWAGTKFWIDARNDMQVLVITQLLPSDIGGVNLEPPVRRVIRNWLNDR